MKAKFLFIVFSLLLCAPIYAHESSKPKVKIENKRIINKGGVTRAPIEFDFDISDNAGTLIITFGNKLLDADISINDCNGNVVSESHTDIYVGMVLTVPNATDYPYYIEITSPTLDVNGEITLDE